MRTPPRILIVDDNPTNVKVLATRLAAEGYEVITAGDGEVGLAAAREQTPDLILLDVMMPKLDGFEVCRRLRADPAFPFTPIIMVTAMADSRDVVAGLEAGGDEYLTKPVDHAALAARVRSMLRIKRLHDTVGSLADEVKALWRIARAPRRRAGGRDRTHGRLRRFFSPKLAELIVNGGADDPLKEPSPRNRSSCSTSVASPRSPTPSRRSDGRLREYHQIVGSLVVENDGTLEHFTGDGMTILFNDPVPIPNPAERAVRMALAIREARRPQGGGLGQARLRARTRHRHRAGLCDDRRDRVRGPSGLQRDRHGDESGGAPLRRGSQQPDPHFAEGLRGGGVVRRRRSRAGSAP
jgi:CheY-like chemotaxis protein